MVSISGHVLFAVTNAVYAVGSCKPNLPTFPTISAALAALPQPTAVMVCPGTYNEQVVITKSVTLQGVADGNANGAIIGVPPGGLLANATSSDGQTIAAQLWVNNAGLVNISDLTFDASSNAVSFFPPYVVGVFYQGTGGTANRISTRNQTGNGFGIGVWVEGQFQNSTVTVENSSIHDFDQKGILIENDADADALSVTIKGNGIDGGGGSQTVGVTLGSATSATVSNNLIVRANTGVLAATGASGSVSGNTLTNNLLGIHASADTVSVTSNKIFASGSLGILLGSAAAVVQGNSIIGSAAGVDMGCLVNTNLNSNTLMDTATALVNVPTSVATTNTYFSVTAIRTGGVEGGLFRGRGGRPSL